MKILNLYAGIGGNRQLWGDSHQITAVEADHKIAAVYSRRFPNDTVVVGDAHQFLLDHCNEYDFVWSSPPCTTHSQLQIPNNAKGAKRYPDMTLYQEIIFLTTFCRRAWVVENVRSYYKPLIPPVVVDRHYVWASFPVEPHGTFKRNARNLCHQSVSELAKSYGVDLSDLAGIDKRKALRNMVNPLMGKYLLDG